ncbi:Pyridoxal phosphate-dependent transferase [Lactarius tabidus]
MSMAEGAVVLAWAGSDLFPFLCYALVQAEPLFYKIPGSNVITRYVKSSHQNDPGCTVLEILLALFAIRTLLQSRTRADNGEKHFIHFSEKEINELHLFPVVSSANVARHKPANTGKHVLNLANYNFTGLAGNETIKVRAIGALWKYGVGRYVHMDLERDIADFLGTEISIITLKRGDIIVADRGINFAIQRGLQILHSTVRWFEHNDLRSLENVLLSVEKEQQKRRGPLTRRFIVTEGIFEKDGAMIELKLKYKYRLILDESFSFGTVGRTGRGLTELYNVPATQIDMIVGSVANGLNSSGGFCAGSHIVVDHQRINGTSFVFSAAVPALLAVSASEGIIILRNTPSILSTLQENVRAIRAVLDRPPNPTTPAPREAPSFDIAAEERALQDIVDEVLAQGVWINRARRLRGQELVEARPSIRLAVTSALSRKECERAAGVIKAAVTKVLAKRK